MDQRVDGEEDADSATFPSGAWTGFDQGERTSLRQHLHLTFAAGQLAGIGIDAAGEFLIEGHYCPETLEVHLVKTYPGAPERAMSYRGFREIHGIWGVCEGAEESGSGFHIWPQWEDASAIDPIDCRDPERCAVDAGAPAAVVPSWLFQI